jgi:hypothetical protein
MRDGVGGKDPLRIRNDFTELLYRVGRHLLALRTRLYLSQNNGLDRQ